MIGPAARFVFYLVVLIWHASATSAESEASCTQVAKVTEVAEGIYVRQGTHAVVFEQKRIANVGFIVGERCVAVIDTGGSYLEGMELKCAIREVTAFPVCYVINTHVHPDHILGNLAFKQKGVSFIGHVNLERAMALLGNTYLDRAAQQSGKPLGPDYIVMPDRSVNGQIELEIGERKLRVTAHPKAHTNNDLSVYDEKTKTLWLSDLLFMDHIPVIAGSATGWLSVLDELSQVPAKQVVPGHGPVQAGWPDASRDLIRYLSTLRDETRAWLANDGELESAQEQIGYSERRRWYLFDQYHKRNVIAVYTDLEWED